MWQDETDASNVSCKVASLIKRFEFELKSLGKLFGSSLVSAGCLVLLTSNRVRMLDTGQVIFLVLFMQWQALGLTISKLGIEHAVFACVTKDLRIRVRPWNFLLRRTVPLALLFSVILCVYADLYVSLALFLSIALDTYSLIRNAELNARKFFTRVSIANLLNYPLFFALLLGVGSLRHLETRHVLGFFVLSSLARAVWLWGYAGDDDRGKDFVFLADWEMGLQQSLNYVLFRVDQIYLAAFLPALSSDPLKKEFMARYLFMARFPELITVAGLIAGAVLIPQMYIHFPFERSWLLSERKYHLLLAVSAIAISVSVGIYALWVWRGGALGYRLVVPFAIHSLLIFPANLLTYSMLRQGHLRGLIRNLFVCALAGALVLWILHAEHAGPYLAWLIPAQLAMFLGLGFLGHWGPRRELFEFVK